MRLQQQKAETKNYTYWCRYVHKQYVKTEQRLLDDLIKYGVIDVLSESFLPKTTQSIRRKRLERHYRLGHVTRFHNGYRYIYTLSKELIECQQ
jgi:hypothetical protein